MPDNITFEASRTLAPIYTGGSVALDKNGRILVTTLGEDVLLTDLSNGKQLAKIEGDGESITCLALTSTASHLICCSRSLSMRIYGLQAGPSSDLSLTVTLLRTVKAHAAPVICCACDETGTLVATGGADSLVKVWDIRAGYATHNFRGHSGLISSLKFFIDSSTVDKRSGSKTSEDPNAAFRLASGGEDGNVRVWNLLKGTSVATLEGHVSVVRDLDFSIQEKALISASRDKTVIVWDAKSWKQRRVIPVLEGVETAGFLGDGTLLYSGGEMGKIRLWEVEHGRELTEEQVAGNEGDMIIQSIYYPGNSSLLSVHADQSLVLHSVESLSAASVVPLRQIQRVSGTLDEIIDLTVLGTDTSLLAVASNSEDVRILSVKSGDSPGEYFGADVALLKGHDEIVVSLDSDASGLWLATGAKDNTARLWQMDPDTSTFTCEAVFKGHAETVGAVALPKLSGSRPPFLLSGSQDRTIKRWDIPASGPIKAKAKYTKRAHEKDINALDVDYEAELFASASQDRTVKIWTVHEGEVIGVLRGHKRGVWAVKFAPKNTPNITNESGRPERRLILTGSGDKTVKIWSLEDYSCLRTFEGHTNSVLKVVWLNPRSKSRDAFVPEVASSGGDGLVKVWNVVSGEILCTLDNHEDRVWAMTTRKDQNTIISGAGDGTISFWTDTTEETAAASTAAANALVEQTQDLENYIYAGEYRSAITLALQLNHPGRLLSIFTTVLSQSPEKGSLIGSKAVDGVIGSLADEQLYLLLLRIRDWNTNAKTAAIAQKLLWTVVNLYSAERLTTIKPAYGKSQTSPKDLFNALKAYTERHYQRNDELIHESYLLEYTLREMDETALATDVDGMALN